MSDSTLDVINANSSINVQISDFLHRMINYLNDAKINFQWVVLVNFTGFNLFLKKKILIG